MDVDEAPRPPAGTITIELDDADRRVLRLSGEVDTAVATRFANSQRRDRVVVDAIDAGAVTFISSSGLALMLMSAEASRAAGRPPVLRAASHAVDRALRLAGIDNLFPRPDIDEGVSPPAREAGGVEARAAEAPPEPP
jgi:anti-anti-sigma factor